MRVYLAGPITGHSFGEITNWRTFVRQRLPTLEVLDPTAVEYDAGDAYTEAETASKALQRLNHGRVVTSRNKLLIKNSDLVLANFLSAKSRVSIGTTGEIFWADSFDKPVIIVREKSGNIHDHAMLNAIASRVCYSLEEGCEAIRSMILAPSSLASGVAS